MVEMVKLTKREFWKAVFSPMNVICGLLPILLNFGVGVLNLFGPVGWIGLISIGFALLFTVLWFFIVRRDLNLKLREKIRVLVHANADTAITLSGENDFGAAYKLLDRNTDLLDQLRDLRGTKFSYKTMVA